MDSSAINQIVSQLPSLAYPALGTLPRLTAAFLILPLLTKAFVPRQIRIGLMLVLGLAIYPAMAVSFSQENWFLGDWIVFVAKEFFIGGLIGYSVGILLWALAAMGELIDNQAAFTNAQIFNPFGGHSGGPFSAFMAQFGGILFIGLGGLKVFIQILYESFLLWPPSSFWPVLRVSFLDFTISSSGSLLEIATRLAAPIIGTLLIIEIGIGLINRAAPQFNAFYASMPIKAAAAFLMLALLLSQIVDAVRLYIISLPKILQNLNNLLSPI